MELKMSSGITHSGALKTKMLRKCIHYNQQIALSINISHGYLHLYLSSS